ncbi:MAG: hypothetical protein HW391_1623, partial [Chloroflexi bacterium]|nr:hypothetical protein [Chloroflexota bacterium]
IEDGRMVGLVDRRQILESIAGPGEDAA